MTSSSRAFVLGLDGVPWHLLERWARAGHLPNVLALLDDGSCGPLRSTTPPSTPLAWPSIATGVRPDGHGIYSFRSLEPNYTHRTNTSRDVRQRELWDLVSPSVVGNVPMTYPADDTDATVVSGMMTPKRDRGFTNPPGLADEIEDRIPEYVVGLSWEEYHGREDAFLDALAGLVDARRELMDLLLDREDWRLFFFVYTAPDRLQHLVWEESTLLAHYRTLDEIVGDAMAVAEREDATLYVVSDHGFGPVEKLVYVNGLLEREGYLVRRGDDGVRGFLARLGLDKQRVLGLLERAGIDDRTLVNYLPRPVLDAAAERVPGDHSLFDLDYERTVAFAHGPGNVYVNDTERFTDGVVDPSEVEALKTELAEYLESVVDPATGARPLQVWDADHLPAEDAPDLIVRGRNGYAKRTALTDEAFVDSETIAGHHEREGIFLAWGEDVRAAARVDDASVVDVAPTVLHGLGESIPARTDGRVLDSIFASDSGPASRTPTTTAYEATDGDGPDRDFDAVVDRLRGLGYLE